MPQQAFPSQPLTPFLLLLGVGFICTQGFSVCVKRREFNPIRFSEVYCGEDSNDLLINAAGNPIDGETTVQEQTGAISFSTYARSSYVLGTAGQTSFQCQGTVYFSEIDDRRLQESDLLAEGSNRRLQEESDLVTEGFSVSVDLYGIGEDAIFKASGWKVASFPLAGAASVAAWTIGLVLDLI